jgi:flagellar protein FliO/FliZ
MRRRIASLTAAPPAGGVRAIAAVAAVAVAGFAAAACLVPDTALAAGPGPGAGATGTQLLRLALGLAAVIGLLLVSARLLPRLGGGALVGSDALRVVAQLQVGQRERVVVLQVGERQVMVGVAPGRVEMLHLLEEPLPARERGTATPVMAGWLGRTLMGRRP